MKHHRFAVAATALAVPLTFGAWTTAQAADLVETMRQSDQFQIMARAIEAAGMAEQLQNGGPYTVFAPTDEAFAALPAATADALFAAGNEGAPCGSCSGTTSSGARRSRRPSCRRRSRPRAARCTSP